MPVRRILILAIALLPVVSAGAPAAAESVDWAFSGAAIQDVALADDCSMLLINVEAKGSPGAASIFGLNRDCPGGGENSLVARFNDGSLLNMLIDTEQPTTFDIVPPYNPYTFKITFWVYFNGGFGRFEDATGTAYVVLYAAPVGVVEDGPSSLLHEYGTFTGTVEYDSE